MNSAWARNAYDIKVIFCGYVDWEEHFYRCPYCDEPVYEEDWNDDELTHFICPICEDEDADLYE